MRKDTYEPQKEVASRQNDEKAYKTHGRGIHAANGDVEESKDCLNPREFENISSASAKNVVAPVATNIGCQWDGQDTNDKKKNE